MTTSHSKVHVTSDARTHLCGSHEFCPCKAGLANPEDVRKHSLVSPTGWAQPHMEETWPGQAGCPTRRWRKGWRQL
jgi:hypothetical protein